MSKKDPAAEPVLVPLSKRHQKVLKEYLISFSQVKAYQKAYPSVTYDSAKASAARLFADVNFKSHLQSRLDESHMSADEAVKRMTDQARADVGDIVDVEDDGFSFSIEKAKKAGKTSLIKKLKQKRTIFLAKKPEDEDRVVVEIEIELHDSQSALDKILRVHGKYKDNVDVTTNGEKVKGNIGWSPENWNTQREKKGWSCPVPASSMAV